MRIAITTWHTGSNSGTFFQLYGLYQYLKGLGYEVKVVEYIHQSGDSISRGFMYYALQLVPLVTNKWKKHKAYKEDRVLQQPYKQFIYARDQRCSDFWSALEYTSSVRTQEEFERLNDLFNAFVVGSDQVWNATIGDFWNNACAKVFKDVSNGSSLILFNSAKAESLRHVFEENGETHDIHSLQDAIGGTGGQLKHPCKYDIRCKLIYVLYKLFGTNGPKLLFRIDNMRMHGKQNH